MSQKPIFINLPAGADSNFDADDFSGIFYAMVGTDGIIGTGLECTRINDNTVRLSEGEFLLQGHLLRIPGGETLDLTVDSGTLGMNRNDLVVAQFIRRADINEEDTLEFAVVKGTSTSGTPADPTLTQNDLNAGGTIRQVALYRLPITGTTLGTPLQLAHNIERNTGWLPLAGTCAYVSATSFTVVGDKTWFLSKGAIVKWYQSGWKYGIVSSASYSTGTGLTTVTLVNNNNYSVLNAEILRPYFSKSAAPYGFTDLMNARARAYLSTAMANITSAAYTKVTLNAETYDPGSNFDSTTNYRFTAPVSGYYHIRGQVMFSNVTVADKLFIGSIYVNGASVADDYKHNSAAQSICVQPSCIVYLGAGDYIELYGRQDTGVNTVSILNNSKYTFLEVAFMSI